MRRISAATAGALEKKTVEPFGYQSLDEIIFSHKIERPVSIHGLFTEHNS